MGLFTTPIKTLDDLFVHTLQDIYYAERQIVNNLPVMIGKASNSELKSAFQQHLSETENQVRRLPILNRDKRLTGIVSLADIAQTGEECEKTALEGVSEPSSEARREPALS